MSFCSDKGRLSDGKIRENPFVQFVHEIVQKDTVDKIAKAAMSKEMLAAGLAAAAAAISASPKARRAIRDAGLDAADTASQAASSVARVRRSWAH